MAEATTSSTTVAAAPAEVMAVIADFAAYPEWAGGVREADVLATGAEGRAARVRFVLDAGAVKDTYTLAYTWQDDVAVRWHLVEPGSVLRAMDGSYTLVPTASGTDVTYTLTVEVSIPLIGMFRRKAERAITDTALRELKRRVER